MDKNQQNYQGSCHCGRVKFQVRLQDGLNTARRCSCSYCRMRGAVAVSATLDGLTITEGADSLSVYQFHTGAAKHYFCSRCGIYTHHQRRSNGTQFGINAACLEGLSPFDFPEVPVLDGVNHPNDTGGTVRQLGTLRFVASE
jgi:hypothetical protein